MTTLYRTVAACAAFVLVALAPALAADRPAGTGVQSQLKADLQRYLAARGSIERVSAASLSVSLPNHRTIDVAAGTTAYGGGEPVTPAHLFQIGSNTKAFTAVLALKLEAQHKLALDDTVGRWFPQYGAWKGATFRQLLHMITGIPTYDDTQAWMSAYVANPYRNFTPEQLVSYVYPQWPKKHVWIYSNTGYVLTELAIEKASGRDYADVLRDEVIAPTGISDLYYYPDIYPRALLARTVSGYFYNDSPDNAGLAPMLGKDQRDYSLSWARGAGGIVATPHAVALWARDLYRGDILTQAERAQMESLVSTKTADPIADVSDSDPRGFGLGLAKMQMPGLGTFWFYEGMTLGYRMLHAYFPKENVVVALGLNSQPPSDRNQSGPLIATIVKTLKANGLF